MLPGHSSSTFLFICSNFSLFPPSLAALTLVSAILIYWLLRFNVLFHGEVSVFVSDLRSLTVVIPEDLNLHMDVTSDACQRIHCVTWFTPAVSACSSTCTYEGLCFWFHLLFGVSLSGLEATHFLLEYIPRSALPTIPLKLVACLRIIITSCPRKVKDVQCWFTCYNIVWDFGHPMLLAAATADAEMFWLEHGMQCYGNSLVGNINTVWAFVSIS